MSIFRRVGRFVGRRHQRHRERPSVVVTEVELARLVVAAGDPNLLVGRVFHAKGQASDQLLKDLLERGANPNARSDENIPLTHLAANRLLKLKLLIDFGADINALDARGWTPVMSLASDGAFDEALYLVQRGADVFHIAPDESTLSSILERVASQPEVSVPKSYRSLADAVARRC